MSIKSEQIRQLFSASSTQLVSGTFLAGILAYMQRSVIDLSVLYTWFITIVLVALSRFLLMVAYQRSTLKSKSENDKWLLKFRLGTLVSGITWGSSSFLLFPANDPSHQLFLLFMLAGLSAGGVASYSADLICAILFSLSVLIPVIVRLLMVGDSLNISMALTVVLYLGFMLMILRNVNRNVYENIVLRLEAIDREEIVKNSEEHYRLLLNHSPIGIIHYDINLVITYGNNHFASILHTPIHKLIGMDLKSIPDQTFLPTLQNALTGDVCFFEGYYRTNILSGIWISMTCAPFQDAKRNIIGGIAIIQDITERKHDEANLRIAATAFEAQEGMIVTDANTFIIQVNRTFSQITGYSANEVINENIALLYSNQFDTIPFEQVKNILSITGRWVGEIWSVRKSGEIYPAYVTISAVNNPNNNIITNYVATITDITQRKIAEEEINNLAFYDPLTKLPNRRLLHDRLQQALTTSVHSGRKGALLLIDLDNFKVINDTLGHDIGDLLLQQVAQRLLYCLREADTVARFGGDEFVVILENLSEQEQEAIIQTEITGKKIIDSLSQPYMFGFNEYYSTPSIGIVLFNAQNETMDILFKEADIAMYQAKKAGRNTLRFFDRKMQESISKRAELESELRKAIEQQQFQLFYQIQVDEAFRTYGAETLIRWLHPERGIILPSEFIPLAEETGLIQPIGRWVLETACAQLNLWSKNPLTQDLVLSVNVSSLQFHQTDFISQVKEVVHFYGINPKKLSLELTETILIDNIETVIFIMNSLKSIGIQFSLDDFGTGYSSLQYLKRLPLDRIKIDKSFIQNIVLDNNDRMIVNAIISMAKNLAIEVIAEGVENEEQRLYLLKNGCTHYQGYYFGKPVNIQAFEASLNSH